MRLPTIASALGIILTAFGAIMLLPIIVALIEHEHSSIGPFGVASAVSIGSGLLCRWYGRFNRNFDNLKQHEGLLIVAVTFVFV